MSNANDSSVGSVGAPAPAAPPPRVSPRTTAKSVLFFDALAGAVVRVGGIAVILAVIGILVFLVATAIPLFKSARIIGRPVAGKVPVDGHVFVLAVDEYRQLACAIGEAPEVVCFRPETGEVIERFPIPRLESTRLTCAHRAARSGDTAVGTTDGRVAFLSVLFSSDFVLGKEAEELRTSLTIGQVKTVGAAIVQRKPGGNLLRVRPQVASRGDLALPHASGGVVTASYASLEGGGAALAVTSDGKFHLVRESEGGDGGEGRSYRLAPVSESGPGTPGELLAALVDEEARVGWLVGRDGSVLRLDLTASPALRREARYTGQPGVQSTRLTAAELLIGGRSLILGDAQGGLSIWSSTPLEASEVGGSRDPGDARTLSRLHLFDPFSSAVVAICPSPTQRSFCLGHEDGGVTLGFSTNERILGWIAAFRGRIEAIASGSKNDGFLVVGPGLGYRGFDTDSPHPETNARALFSPLHYEGFSKPEYQYQSSASTDEAELKLCLTPLIFGTLKSTFYAMLFALPLAIFAAIYVSQFMHHRVRNLVKPGVEVMASLPSVVLGFVAALVLAPAIEKVVPGVFAALFGVAVVGFVTGFLWYLTPSHIRHGVTSGQRLLIAVALVATTIWVSLGATPLIERTLFAGPKNPTGDFRVWMLCQEGTGTGTPLLRLGLFVLGSALGIFLLPRWWHVSTPRAGRLLQGALRTLAYAVLPGLVLAVLAGPIEHVLFSDAFRWFLVGKSDKGTGTTYDQRNSLVVGIAMGFAVIPIIFTIAEDALAAIPDSLRSAALGCGASPWQAAMRVIVPAAIPGIFSGVMIGLGRAIGETMIVLMAAGGTAIIDGSLFNGFRTLSVNIATELPEAPEGGTLYRVLFLAGLLLFALTFVLNTVAEAVRIRFRKKFKGL